MATQKLNKKQLREIIRESVCQRLTEFNHMLYGNDWYFDEPDSEERTAHVKAYYYNEESDEELEKEYDIQVTVYGYYEKEWDDGYYAVFEEDWDSSDINGQVSDEIPKEIEGGFVLQDWDVEDID